MGIGKRIFLEEKMLDQILAQEQSASDGISRGYVICAGRNGWQYAIDVLPGTSDNIWIARDLSRSPKSFKLTKSEKKEFFGDEKEPSPEMVLTNFFVIPYTSGPIIYELDRLTMVMAFNSDRIQNYLRPISKDKVYLYSLREFPKSINVPRKGGIKLYDNSFMLETNWNPTTIQQLFLRLKRTQYEQATADARKTLSLWENAKGWLQENNDSGPSIMPSELGFLL